MRPTRIRTMSPKKSTAKSLQQVDKENTQGQS